MLDQTQQLYCFCPQGRGNRLLVARPEVKAHGGRTGQRAADAAEPGVCGLADVWVSTALQLYAYYGIRRRSWSLCCWLSWGHTPVG